MKATLATSGGELVSLFHALSDETRIRIVDVLRSGGHCVCELNEVLELSQSLLSFHLRVLKEAGLVQDRREGRWVYYALDPEVLTRMGGFLHELGRSPRRGKNPRCCD